MSVSQLGYIGLEVEDMAAWQSLATEVLGFEVRGDSDGPQYLRIDERHHRFALYPAKENKLAYFGWDAGTSDNFDVLVSALENAGVKITQGTEADRKDRKVERLVKFQDPGGFNVELFTGAEVDPQPFLPSRPISGFVTGAQGLGHIVLSVDDPDATYAFYRDVLGMKLSDTVTYMGIDLIFLHCNSRHHSLALAGPRKGIPSGKISHFMVEVNALDDVGRAYDMCLEREIPIWMSLGQHTNDEMVSFYLRSPSGFSIEYGYGGRIVDDASWQVQHWNAASLWGHKVDR